MKGIESNEVVEVEEQTAPPGKNNEALHIAAQKIMEDLDSYFRGIKGRFVKQLVKRVNDRFKRDEIDDEAFGYIISTLLKDFGALDDLYKIFDKNLVTNKKQRGDQIVADIRSVLNSRVIKAYVGETGPQDFVKIFEAKMIIFGLDRAKAIELAKIIWGRVQQKLEI